MELSDKIKSVSGTLSQLGMNSVHRLFGHLVSPAEFVNYCEILRGKKTTRSKLLIVINMLQNLRTFIYNFR